MVSDNDPHDLDPGQVQYQENITALKGGALQGRRGYQMLAFSMGSTTAGYPIIAMYNFQSSPGSYIVYHDTNNQLRAGMI